MCSTARFSVMLIFLPVIIAFYLSDRLFTQTSFSLTWARSASFSKSSFTLGVSFWRL